MSAAVGQKCPDCSRQARSARAQGKPRQYVKAAAAGTGTAAAVGAGLFLVIGTVGFLTWIAAGFGGYGVARAVDAGAERNKATPFRVLAVVLAVGAVLGAWIVLGLVTRGTPILLPRGFGIVTYLAAAYGAWIVYR